SYTAQQQQQNQTHCHDLAERHPSGVEWKAREFRDENKNVRTNIRFLPSTGALNLRGALSS
ncbi:unnamed protein product, partial [Pylaiella littoralis]